PVADLARMFAADDAADLAAAPNRSVDDRRDADRAVIVVESRRARIALRFVGSDRALGLERAKVQRVIGGAQLFAGAVTAGEAVEDVGASDERVLFVEEPDADTCDVERLRRGFGQITKRWLEIAGMDRRSPREIDEDLILPAQTRLGVAQQDIDARVAPLPL